MCFKRLGHRTLKCFNGLAVQTHGYLIISVSVKITDMISLKLRVPLVLQQVVALCSEGSIVQILSN
jgi:hypothetical protein